MIDHTAIPCCYAPHSGGTSASQWRPTTDFEARQLMTQREAEHAIRASGPPDVFMPAIESTSQGLACGGSALLASEVNTAPDSSRGGKTQRGSTARFCKRTIVSSPSIGLKGHMIGAMPKTERARLQLPSDLSCSWLALERFGLQKYTKRRATE